MYAMDAAARFFDADYDGYDEEAAILQAYAQRTGGRSSNSAAERADFLYRLRSPGTTLRAWMTALGCSRSLRVRLKLPAYRRG